MSRVHLKQLDPSGAVNRDVVTYDGANWIAARAAVIFDDFVVANKRNIRSNRASNQSVIDNTKVGITNFGTQDGSWNALAAGVTASWSSVLGGVDNEATDDNSVVSGGAGNSATGYSSAVGGGYLNIASGEGSFAAGTGNLAVGESSVALGNLNVAGSLTQEFCFAAGLDGNATGFSSATLNSNGTASNDYAFATGSNGLASGTYSRAGGSNCIASGSFSVAEGSSCLASGAYSHATGSGCQATDFYTNASGVSCNATQDGAHAEGFSTTASGTGAHSQNDFTLASGEASHAEGRSTTASGNRSHAQGIQSIASRESQDAMASGGIAIPGDAQASSLVLRGTTPGAGAGESVVLRYGQAFDQDFTLQNDRSYTIIVTAIAQGTTPQQLQSFKQMFAVRVNNVGAGTMAALGVLEQIGDAAAVTWTLTGSVIAGPQFRLTFNTGTTTEATRVVARVDFVEVQFP